MCQSSSFVIMTFQESVVSTVVKLCLKSLQEFVRLQTLNRSGYQQIQLDIEFLKNPLKEYVDDEAAIDFLLKEVKMILLLLKDKFFHLLANSCIGFLRFILLPYGSPPE